MSRWRAFADAARRGLRWLAPAALVALAPKCAVCVLGYAGLAATLGLGGRELCGGSAGPSPSVAVTLGALAVAALLRRLVFRGQRPQLQRECAAPPAVITLPGQPSAR